MGVLRKEGSCFMEMTNKLKSYLEEHSEGVVLREVPDEILFEMLAKATECEAEGKKKGTDSFQKFFNLDMSYSTAYKEPARRGYQNIWVKSKDESYNATTGEKVDIGQLTVDVEPFSAEKFCRLLLGKENRKEVQRLYVRAYPESIEELKRLAGLFPRGIKGQMEAIIFEKAIESVALKYEMEAKNIEEF